MVSHDSPGGVDITIEVITNNTHGPVTFAERLAVGINQYLLTMFLPGYKRWGFTYFARNSNGVGIYVWPVKLGQTINQQFIQQNSKEEKITHFQLAVLHGSEVLYS